MTISDDSLAISRISVDVLADQMGFQERLEYPESSRKKSFASWRMEDDDQPIFRYLYRNFRPKRHLEFGTWQGTGLIYCLEECDATVWTINLLEGENKPDGTWAYGELVPSSEIPSSCVEVHPSNQKGLSLLRTDAYSNIGRFYLERNLGYRVCQIYCDSRNWDTRNYPDGFFDTALIDGGHEADVVTSDSLNALRLVRPGGLILWHDFCPDPHIINLFETTQGVVSAIDKLMPTLRNRCSSLFWVDPSFILVGQVN